MDAVAVLLLRAHITCFGAAIYSRMCPFACAILLGTGASVAVPARLGRKAPVIIGACVGRWRTEVTSFLATLLHRWCILARAPFLALLASVTRPARFRIETHVVIAAWWPLGHVAYIAAFFAALVHGCRVLARAVLSGEGASVAGPARLGCETNIIICTDLCSLLGKDLCCALIIISASAARNGARALGLACVVFITVAADILASEPHV